MVSFPLYDPSDAVIAIAAIEDVIAVMIDDGVVIRSAIYGVVVIRYL